MRDLATFILHVLYLTRNILRICTEAYLAKIPESTLQVLPNGLKPLVFKKSYNPDLLGSQEYVRMVISTL